MYESEMDSGHKVMEVRFMKYSQNPTQNFRTLTRQYMEEWLRGLFNSAAVIWPAPIAPREAAAAAKFPLCDKWQRGSKHANR